MNPWKRSSPGLVRLLVLAVAAALIAWLARGQGVPVDWGLAVIYGITTALAMRWPIVMPGTGARVVLTTGVLLEAVWYHGLPTGLVILLVEFAIRMVVLYRGRYFWEWYRPVIVLVSLTAASSLAWAVGQDTAKIPHGLFPRFDTAGLTLAFAFWALLNAAWSYLRAPKRGRTRTEEYLRCMQQTWWAPLVFVLVAWPLAAVHVSGYSLEAAVCLLLLWFHSRVGPVFTTLHQDRAAADMVRQFAARSPEHRLASHRVLIVAHGLAQTLHLSPDEMRVIGYAVLLQDPPGPHSTVPLWLAEQPSVGMREAVRKHVDEAVGLIERDGVLQEAANLVRYRYAAYDGQGYPEIGGDVIPTGAQVLAAANALVQLSQGGRSLADAAAWLRDHAANRFSPRVLGAVLDAQLNGRTPLDDGPGLPETVRQLQGLLGGPDRPATLMIGMRRLWLQFRGKVGLVPDLPAEVQAVARLSTLFSSNMEADRTAGIIVEAVGRLIGAKVALAVVDGDKPALSMQFKATHGFQHMQLIGCSPAVAGGPMSRAILHQEPVQVVDMRELNSALSHEMAGGEGLRSVLFAPMAARGQTIGLLIVGMQSYHWFTPQEVGLIHLMGGLGAMALENARLIAEAADRLEHISELKAFTDTLLDNLSVSIIVVDQECRLVMCNAAARAWLGADGGLQEGCTLPNDLCAACQVERVLTGESVPERDVPWGASTLEVAAIPLQNEHGVLQGAICMARDVTRVRMMEQQVRRVEKMAAIGELAAGAAHEIRNPLTAIRGFIQLLQVKAAAAGDDYFRIILGEIDRIDGIIHDLLLLARPAELKKVSTSVPALMDEVLLLNQAEYERQGVMVVKEYEPEVAPVPMDPKMFRQLLLNLILNAFQAMPYGGTLKLSLRTLEGNRIALDVADTGVGIAPENLKRLFVPFYTTKEEGTGLGLALCYNIVQAHQGRIDVHSKIGLGTTFTITLPLA
jgi:nitrogen-specific signal transduction histidine kinase